MHFRRGLAGLQSSALPSLAAYPPPLFFWRMHSLDLPHHPVAGVSCFAFSGVVPPLGPEEAVGMNDASMLADEGDDTEERTAAGNTCQNAL